MGRPPLRLGRPKGRPQAPFQPSHENRYPFTNWSTFAPPKWSKFTPPLTADIANFQIDRNRFEQHLLESVCSSSRVTYRDGVSSPQVELAETGGEHIVRFKSGEVRCRWLVDTTGRGSWLKNSLELAADSPIRHGSTWCWVDGLFDVEKLTDRSWTEVRHDPQRRKAGHFPAFLATNHFLAEGCWFWVIPLHGKTSLGLVYDHAVIDPSEVANAESMIEIACKKWPVLARDLPGRTVVDQGRFVTYSYGAKQTISDKCWAMSGMSGRFSDPLYSPGSDLIAFHNTLIVDAIQSPADELQAKCRRAELLMQVLYEAYEPSFVNSYDCLGDQECFTLKYGWELSIYFGFYVFPFVNGLLTQEEFVGPFLRKFGLLGPLNRSLHKFLSDYFQWKKSRLAAMSEPKLTDFLEMPPVSSSEKMFYEVGRPLDEALEALEGQYQRMREFARFIAVHVCAAVVGDPSVVTNAALVRGLKLRSLRFDPQAFQELYERTRSSDTRYKWTFDAIDFERQLAVEQAAVANHGKVAQ